MRRLDLLVAAVLVALLAFAVVQMLSASAPAPATPAVPVVGIADAVDPDVALRDLEGRRQRLGDLFGARATVLYSWSTTCPCIPWCEKDVHALVGRFGPEQGVAWIAIAGEPTDTPEGVQATAEKLGVPYAVLLDPSHRLCARMGFDRAAVVAVLDADGYLRFRGNLTDRLKDPQERYLGGVLEAVLAGGEPPLAETPLNYGCAFSAPVACEDDAVPAPGEGEQASPSE